MLIYNKLSCLMMDARLCIFSFFARLSSSVYRGAMLVIVLGKANTPLWAVSYPLS